MKSRLQEKYRSETVPALMKHFGWKNVMAVPKLQKVTLNIGLGEASQNAKLLDTAAVELGQISGQKPVITRAKKSIANFKIRKGMPIGCAVTLRGEPAGQRFRVLRLASGIEQDRRGRAVSVEPFECGVSVADFVRFNFG